MEKGKNDYEWFDLSGYLRCATRYENTFTKICTVESWYKQRSNETRYILGSSREIFGVET